MNRSIPWMMTVLLAFLWMSHSHAANGPGTPDNQLSQTQASTSAQDTPSMQVEKPSHDFGEILEGAEVVHEFKIKNKGKGVLQIKQVRPG